MRVAGRGGETYTLIYIYMCVVRTEFLLKISQPHILGIPSSYLFPFVDAASRISFVIAIHHRLRLLKISVHLFDKPSGD